MSVYLQLQDEFVNGRAKGKKVWVTEFACIDYSNPGSPTYCSAEEAKTFMDETIKVSTGTCNEVTECRFLYLFSRYSKGYQGTAVCRKVCLARRFCLDARGQVEWTTQTTGTHHDERGRDPEPAGRAL